MLCQEIMSHEVQWVAPEQSVAHAAELMAFHNLGFLPICSADGRPLGVITDRDIATRVAGKGRAASETRVEEVMTTPIHSVPLDCPLSAAGELMAEAGVSRLLVVSGAGALEGVVSITDLMMRGPRHLALRTARGIYAREATTRSQGHPHLASEPNLEYFHGARDGARDFPFVIETSTPNPARIEAQAVVSASDNAFKEFP
jgi:CBS domain-containing protein